MDVNKAEAVTPVGQQPQKQPQRRNAEDDADRREDADGHGRAETDAVSVDGLLAGGVTPEVQAALDNLSRQIEPLREQVEQSKAREIHFRNLARAHAFLNMPDRREFLRELDHVLTHMEHLSTPPSVVVLHLGNGDEIRRRYGRKALDSALTRVVDVLQAGLHPTDVTGSLGGNDFGVILLSGDGTSVAEKVETVLEGAVHSPVPLPEGSVPLELSAGWSVLEAGWNAERAIEKADADLLRRRNPA